MPTVILRPSGDYNSTTSNYKKINEEKPDDDATYLSLDATSTDTLNNGFNFAMSTTTPLVGKIRINSVKMVSRVRSTDISNDNTCSVMTWLTLNIDNKRCHTVQTQTNCTSTSYVNLEQTATQLELDKETKANIDDFVIDDINAAVAFANFTLSVKKGKAKNDDFQLRITQFYIELEYEEVKNNTNNLYFKYNGSYKSAIRVYKKVSGAWVEQADLPAIFSGGSSGGASNYVYGGSV